MTSETMEFDVVIVGAGPAGLSAAIRLKQLSPELNVCVLEKGAEVGAHILSGAVFEPRALNELLPDWREKAAPLTTPVVRSSFTFLTRYLSFHLPLPARLHSKGCYVISLGKLCRWLGAQAEALDVQIFPGFAAASLHIENGAVAGVMTGEFGRNKQGEEKPGYQPGVLIKAKHTLFAEGCRGSLSEQLMRMFGLRNGKSPQTYGLGIKELWEIPKEQHKPGHVLHSVGWPLGDSTYGGGFLYHMENNLVSVGYVTGLDYKNPYLDPFQEMQRFKLHPSVAKVLRGGKRIAYGARALNEGGFQAIPKLTFAGGALIGDSAGFLNVPKIKGSHTAMKSGMLAAEAIVAGDLESYTERFKASWVYSELREVRNIRPLFRFSRIAGMLHAALDLFILRGSLPWTFKHHVDFKELQAASHHKPIDYPKPDGVLTFDKLSSVYLSSTNHEEDQPVHLKLKNPALTATLNWPLYAAPEQRYCPAGVYEIVREGQQVKLQINAQNCVHCKTCDIKDPAQNIVWTTPEGGGGPNYSNM